LQKRKIWTPTSRESNYVPEDVAHTGGMTGRVEEKKKKCLPKSDDNFGGHKPSGQARRRMGKKKH